MYSYVISYINEVSNGPKLCIYIFDFKSVLSSCLGETNTNCYDADSQNISLKFFSTHREDQHKFCA